MARNVYTLAELTPEQERLLKEAEKTLGDCILLAYSDRQLSLADLTESQMECLQGLEEKTGLTILAVRPRQGPPSLRG